MIITLWSPVHGQTGSSTVAAAIASQICISHKIKTLLTHTNFNHRSLEYSLLNRRELISGHASELTDTGMDALIRLSNNKRLAPDLIPNYTYGLIPNNRLDLLVGTRQQDVKIFDAKSEDIQNVLSCARDKYDLVIVDLNNGFDNQMTQELLQQADFRILVMNQNLHIWEQLLEHPWFDTYFRNEKSLICLNHFNEEIRWTPRNIKRRTNHHAVYTLPSFNKMQDICNRSEVLDFVIRNQDVSRTQLEEPYISHLKKMATHLVMSMGVQVKEKGYSGV